MSKTLVQLIEDQDVSKLLEIRAVFRKFDAEELWLLYPLLRRPEKHVLLEQLRSFKQVEGSEEEMFVKVLLEKVLELTEKEVRVLYDYILPPPTPYEENEEEEE